jgi:hypothetical protein
MLIDLSNTQLTAQSAASARKSIFLIGVEV